MPLAETIRRASRPATRGRGRPHSIGTPGDPPALTVTVEVLGAVLLGALGVIFATPLTAVGIVLVKMLYLQDLFGEEVEVSRAG
jgi:hypothetical protein